MTAGWGAMAGSAAARTLSRMIAGGRLPHALLLAGPPQVGKAQLATSLAQALNCAARPPGQGDPCGDCAPCRRIAGGRHADVETVAPGGVCRVTDHSHENSATVGICQIRRLEVNAALNPYEGGRRVFVIDPADAMTTDASDAFLKTLEEPPDAVTMVLVTDSPARLSETVRSRCRRIDVTPLARGLLAARLAGEDGVTAETADALSRMARGRASWATNALADDDPVAQRRAEIEQLRVLSAGAPASAWSSPSTSRAAAATWGRRARRWSTAGSGGATCCACAWASRRGSRTSSCGRSWRRMRRATARATSSPSCWKCGARKNCCGSASTSASRWKH